MPETDPCSETRFVSCCMRFLIFSYLPSKVSHWPNYWWAYGYWFRHSKSSRILLSMTFRVLVDSFLNFKNFKLAPNFGPQNLTFYSFCVFYTFLVNRCKCWFVTFWILIGHFSSFLKNFKSLINLACGLIIFHRKLYIDLFFTIIIYKPCRTNSVERNVKKHFTYKQFLWSLFYLIVILFYSDR